MLPIVVVMLPSESLAVVIPVPPINLIDSVVEIALKVESSAPTLNVNELASAFHLNDVVA